MFECLSRIGGALKQKDTEMNVMLWLVAVALLMSFVPPSTSPLLVFFLFFLGTVNGILIRDLGLGSKSNCTNRSHK